MQQSMSEVGISHLEPVVRRPKSCSVCVAYTGKATTRCGISFEHNEWFSCLLSEVGGIDVRGDKVSNSGLVFEVKRKDSLGGNDGCAGVELSCAIVVGIAV